MKRVFFLALSCAVVMSCSKNDDSTNNCSQPENISIGQINSTSAFFEWERGGETAFEFEYGERGFSLGNGTIIQTSQREYLIEGLTPLTDYEIFLRSNCGSEGFSEYISANFRTLENVDLCNAPSNLVLVALSATTIELSWDENNETVWEVEYGPVGFALGTGTTMPSSQSNAVLSGLTPAFTYEIYVRANCGDDGFSSYSERLVVTTDAN